MDVKPADVATISARDVVVYGGITALFVGLAYAPTLVFADYPRVLTTLVLLGSLGLVGRSLFAAVLSFKTPALDCPDAELPPVSVVIPAYNEEPVLPDTIAACNTVDYPAEKLEVVLCYCRVRRRPRGDEHGRDRPVPGLDADRKPNCGPVGGPISRR